MNNFRQLYWEDLKYILEFFDLHNYDLSEFIELGWTESNIVNHFKKHNNFSIGYFEKNYLSAILIGEKLSNFEKYELEIHIIFVPKLKRRNNIGSNILNFIETGRKNTKINKIFIEVAENNINAIKFYEKNNFVFFKFRHNYYNVKNNKFNAKCYLKKI